MGGPIPYVGFILACTVQRAEQLNTFDQECFHGGALQQGKLKSSALWK